MCASVGKDLISFLQAAVADDEWHYIASQTPLDGYQDEMWDMVWLNNASIIVLLTQEVVSSIGNRIRNSTLK